MARAESAVNTQSGPIYQRVNSVYATLPSQAQRVADVVLDHLGDLGTYSVAELAQMSGASAATVSRLFAGLGFADFAEVKSHARALRREGIPIPSESTEIEGARRYQQEVDNLRRLLESNTRIEELASLIAGAKQVLVIGFRNSFPVAMHLRQALLQSRTDVDLVPQQGQSMGEELANYGRGDVIVVLGFRRRLSQFDDLMRFLAATDATIALIADATARRHADRANLWLDCPIDSVGAFDSFASAMALSSMVADRVLQLRGQSGRRNVVRVASAYESLNELDGEDLGYRRYRSSIDDGTNGSPS